MKRIITTIFILFLFFQISAQIKDLGTIPFIKYYSPEEYNAARQNWTVIQDKRGLMYFGNADGSVLEFDGQNWNRIKVSSTAIRSLCADKDNIIFVGGNNIFGMLKPTSKGDYTFKSLADKIPEKHSNFQDIWDIFITKDDKIFFHTFDEIFIYDYDTVKVLSISDYFPQGLFLMAYQLDDEIYIYTKYKGLYKLKDNDLEFISSSSVIDSSMVRALLPYRNDKKIIFTWFDGAFEFDNNTITPITTPIDNIISHDTYRVIDIKNKYFGFLLYSGGFIITDKNFNIVRYLKSPEDLVNDKFYKTYLDSQDNLWLCSDNGITSIYLFSPFSLFDKDYGFENEATCFSSVLTNNKLYIGTNSGVFVKDWDKINKSKGKFELLPNPSGNYKTQEIKLINGKIIAASAGGLFNIDTTISSILANRAVRTFVLTEDEENTIIGLSAAIFIFKKVNDNWVFYKDIQGFTGHYLEQDIDKSFWISDIIGGVTNIKFNNNYTDIVESRTYNDSTLNGLPGGNDIKIFKINKNIIFSTPVGLYQYKSKIDSFVPYLELIPYIDSLVNVSYMSEDSKGNIWVKKQIEENKETNWELSFLQKNDSGYTLIYNPFLYLRNKIYSLDQISDSEYIIGGPSGFVHYDASIDFNLKNKFPAFIRSVKINSIDSVIFYGNFFADDSLISFEQNEIPELQYKYGNLRFTFSGAYYQDLGKIQYSYYLEGNDEKWSEWTTENYKDYSNLKPKEYTFWVEAKNSYGIESSVAWYKFVIKPPWYLTTVAFILYIVVAGLLVWLVTYLYTLRLRKQKEYLELQVKLRTNEIEQQKQEIEAQRDQLEENNVKIQKINKDITDSIEYAKRIQTAMLPLEKNIREHLSDYFILFKPRDIVSGDFYWFSHKNDLTFIAAVDCTGHGVPGAFMSMIGAEILTTIVNNKDVYDAAEILDLLNKDIRTALKQDTTENQDGMDMALCVIDKKNKKIDFAGAKNPLFYTTDGEINKIRGNKQSIGGYQFGEFVKHTIEYTSPTWFYIFSDGYADQFGGDDNSKFMIKQFKDILTENYLEPMEKQKLVLKESIEDWMIGKRQTDDILVIGFKL